MGHATGCEPKPWQKLEGGKDQGTATELTHLEIAMFSSAEFRVPLIHLAELRIFSHNICFSVPDISAMV